MSLATNPEFGGVYFSAGGFSLPRPITPDVFPYGGVNRQGDKRLDFRVEFFGGSTLSSNKELIRGIEIGIHEDVFKIPHEQAVREVNESQRGGLRFKSVILARVTSQPESRYRGGPLVTAVAGAASAFVRFVSEGKGALKLHRTDEPAQTDDYIAYAAQEMWTLPVEGRRKPLKVMYLDTLAIKEYYRRLGLAAKFIAVANAKLEPDIIVLRTRAGAVVTAMDKSHTVDGEPKSPLDVPFDADPVMAAVLALADKNTVHPKPINPSTGVTDYLYEEVEDRAYFRDSNHPASKIDERMEKLGLVSAKGGAMYIAVRVRGRQRWLSPRTAVA